MRMIVDREDNQADASKSQTDEPPAQLQEKRFLTVHENHEAVEYGALVELLDEGRRLPSPPDLSSMTSTLKPHQKEGVGWMRSVLHVGLPDVLLADDIGLRKPIRRPGRMTSACGLNTSRSASVETAVSEELGLERNVAVSSPPQMRNPFKYFKTYPAIIRHAMMMYVPSRDGLKLHSASLAMSPLEP
ncbi:hypothetical protein [Maricaulis sp. MIT060901]|uniref:hypothetical protein n=1 Tax=Maricaulis sp. MIT060901 TaxID=3096993 RepID=UPI0039997367